MPTHHKKRQQKDNFIEFFWLLILECIKLKPKRNQFNRNRTSIAKKRMNIGV